MVHQALRDPGRPGDVFNRGGFESLSGNHFQRRIHDLEASFFGLGLSLIGLVKWCIHIN